MKISWIKEILDLRGEPLEADVWLDNCIFGRAAGRPAPQLVRMKLTNSAMPVIWWKRRIKCGGQIEGETGYCLHGIMADDQFLIDQKMIDLDGTPNKG